jgi:hypothetical protein
LGISKERLRCKDQRTGTAWDSDKERGVGMMINFIECDTVEEANKLDLDIYTFVKFSETRQKYIFKIRENRR